MTNCCCCCCALQMFYQSLSPLSGVISPTTFSLLASPVATPRTTPRVTPIPRWLSLDAGEVVDYSQITVNMDSGPSTDEGDGPSGKSILGQSASILGQSASILGQSASILGQSASGSVSRLGLLSLALFDLRYFFKIYKCL